MTNMYYKTDDAKILAAYHDFNNKANDLAKKGHEWAAQFDAEPLFISSGDGVFLAQSLHLNNRSTRKDICFWSTPVDGGSRPLAITNKRVPDKQAAQELRKKFTDTRPRITSVSREELFKTIGVDWSCMLFGNLNIFEFNGCLYISCGIKLNSTEILGSEFADAKAKSAK